MGIHDRLRRLEAGPGMPQKPDTRTLAEIYRDETGQDPPPALREVFDTLDQAFRATVGLPPLTFTRSLEKQRQQEEAYDRALGAAGVSHIDVLKALCTVAWGEDEDEPPAVPAAAAPAASEPEPEQPGGEPPEDPPPSSRGSYDGIIDMYHRPIGTLSGDRIRRRGAREDDDPPPGKPRNRPLVV